MKKAIARLPSFDDETGNLNVIVETPQGSRIKYAYEPATGLFEMDKMLPSGMVFPFDFGFIPSTHGEDGDPLDVLVLSEAPLFAGCHVHAQMVGGLRAEQKERDQRVLRNDRLIAVPVWPTMPRPPQSIHEIDDKLLRELESFFVAYNKGEGREFTVLERMDRKEAEKIVRQSPQRAEKTKK